MGSAERVISVNETIKIMLFFALIVIPNDIARAALRRGMLYLELIFSMFSELLRCETCY